MGIERLSKLLFIARRPVESVVFVIALSLFLFSLYLGSPWYEPGYDRVVSDSPQDRITEYIAAVIFFTGSLPGIVFPFLSDTARDKALKFVTFFMFIAFLFQAALRIVSVGWTPLHWLAVFVLALVSGVLRLYLEVKKE